MQQNTLLFLYRSETREILLAMKKRKFGKGKWNGVGGKVEEGESIQESAIREAKEEIGVKIIEENMKEVANINFLYEDKEEWNQETKVFLVEEWVGKPTETEEMMPKWYSVDKLPYNEMWFDDIHWLHRILNGEILKVDLLL